MKNKNKKNLIGLISSIIISLISIIGLILTSPFGITTSNIWYFLFIVLIVASCLIGSIYGVYYVKNNNANSIKILEKANKQEYERQVTCPYCGTIFEWEGEVYDTESSTSIECPECSHEIWVNLRCLGCKKIFCQDDDAEHNLYCKKCREKQIEDEEKREDMFKPWLY